MYSTWIVSVLYYLRDVNALMQQNRVKAWAALITLASLVMTSFFSSVTLAVSTIQSSSWSSHSSSGIEKSARVNAGSHNPILEDSQQGDIQYVRLEGSELKIAHKYNADNDMWMIFDFAGANALYGMKEWRLSPNTKPGVSSDLDRSSVMLMPDISDWIGPYIVGADQHGNGKGQEFTGGNHNYDGSVNGSVTGRTLRYDIRVDGKKLKGKKIASAKRIKIQVVNRIQGFNTKEADGSGREILQEAITYVIEGGKVDVHVKVTPLEDITLYRYYGLQSVNGAWNQDIRYFAGNTEVAQHEASKYSDSGSKAAHPGVDQYWLRSAIQNGTTHNLLVSLDREYGLGRLDFLADDQPIAFTQEYGKSYFLQVYNKEAHLKRRHSIAWQGSYHFFSTMNPNTHE